MYTTQLKRMDTKKNIILLILVGILIVTAASGCKREPTEHSTKPEPKPRSIHEAAKVGSKTAVEEFLLKGNAINMKDKFGMTPLHYAAAYGQKEVAEFLLANGADVDAKNERGGTPLGQAVMGVGHNKEVAELLITKGADVNSRNLDGRTPLHKAAMSAEPDLIEMLLNNGADPEATDNDGKTPLDRAISLSEIKFRRGSPMAERKNELEACVQILRKYTRK